MDINDLTQEPNPEEYRVSPQLLVLITSAVTELIKEEPELNLAEVIYLTVNQFLRAINKRPAKFDLVPAIFGYYLETHRSYALHISQGKLRLQGQGDPLATNLYNKAALSFFDLYLQRPKDVRVRRLLVMASEAMHQVVASTQASIKERPMPEIIADLSDIALLTNTITDYVKGHNRWRNYSYIAWLKEFLEYVVTDYDLTKIRNYSNFNRVVRQVKNRESTILIDNSLLSQIK